MHPLVFIGAGLGLIAYGVDRLAEQIDRRLDWHAHQIDELIEKDLERGRPDETDKKK